MKPFLIGALLALVTAASAPVAMAQQAAGSEQPAAAALPSQSPIDSVKSTIDQIISAVEAMPGQDKREERRQKLRAIISPRFDFKEMAARSLGAHWKTLAPEQRNEFVEVFSDVLGKTYLARIETAKRGMVAVKDERINGQTAEVRSTISNKGDVFPINYKLINRGGTWKVYDVEIENIGLVANYRTEFAGIIRKEQFEGLLRRLRTKNEST